MTGMQVLLCAMIAIYAVAKMSQMPLRLSVVYMLLWGVAGGIATGMFVDMSQQELSAMFDIKGIVTLVFFELILLFAYLFSGGRVSEILSYYPCLMMIVPLCAGAAKVVRLFPGVSFTVIGIFYGASFAAAGTGLILLLKSVGADKIFLYVTALITALISIVIYGII